MGTSPVILAVDLAWTGPSGWVLWDETLPDPLVKYGEFKPRLRFLTKGAIADDHFRFWQETIQWLENIRVKPPIVVYEISDWYQPEGNSYAYARERKVQHALGAAEAVFCLVMFQQKITPVALGAMQTRQQFGAKTKTEAREWLSREYPKIPVMELSDHVTDAIVLAKVYADNLRIEKMIEDQKGL